MRDTKWLIDKAASPAPCLKVRSEDALPAPRPQRHYLGQTRGAGGKGGSLVDDASACSKAQHRAWRPAGCGGCLLCEPMTVLTANSHANSSTQRSPFKPRMAYSEPQVQI